VTALETRLDLLAASGETITYGDLARELGLRMGELTTALESLMEQDAAEARPFRAALCTGRMNHGLPATGFFLKAAELGRYGGGDRDAYVTAERAALRR
jgi:hypothetical protein